MHLEEKRIYRPAPTMLEMVIAMAVMPVVFAVLLPQFTNILNAQTKNGSTQTPFEFDNQNGNKTDAIILNVDTSHYSMNKGRSLQYDRHNRMVSTDLSGMNETDCLCACTGAGDDGRVLMLIAGGPLRP